MQSLLQVKNEVGLPYVHAKQVIGFLDWKGEGMGKTTSLIAGGEFMPGLTSLQTGKWTNFDMLKFSLKQ